MELREMIYFGASAAYSSCVCHHFNGALNIVDKVLLGINIEIFSNSHLVIVLVGVLQRNRTHRIFI